MERGSLDISAVVASSAATAVAVAAVWIAICLVLRATNFRSSGTRRTQKHSGEPEVVAKVIEYHNNAIYKCFEFFFKMTLAILGGIAYVALSAKADQSERALVLIDAGCWLLLGAAIAFSSVISMHQKSKIERWRTRYGWYEPLLWGEYPLITIMFLVALVVRRHLLPVLQATLSANPSL